MHFFGSLLLLDCVAERVRQLIADGGPNNFAPTIAGSPWEASMRAAMEDYSCPAGSVVIFTE
jgi:hypothetical protein